MPGSPTTRMPVHVLLWIAGGAFAGAACAVLIICMMAAAESLGFDMAPERLPGRPLACSAVALFFSAWVASLVGFVCGLFCLVLTRQRTKSAAWGTAVSGVLFFGILVFLMLCWGDGRPS